MLDKLRRLRADHLRIQYGLTFYPYQEVASDAILAALIDNLRITAGASEEEVKKLRQVEIAIEMSRRSGKTEAVARTGEFILTFLPTLFKRKIEIGIFATQVDQAKISYSIMRNGLRQAKQMMPISAEQQRFIAEEENARKLVLPDGSSVVTAPINKTSQIEGIGLDLAIIDEAQLANDEILKHSIWPMTKNLNGPRVYIGKAGTRINYYYRLCQSNDSIKVYFNDVVQQRRQTYEQTGDVRHLIYEQSVRDDIEKQGIEADEIQREYFGKWQIGTGQFTTMEALEALETEHKPTFHYQKADCFAGIDTAKSPDETVLTVLRDTGQLSEQVLPDGTKTYGRKKELLNWLVLKGENYQNQFEIIRQFLTNYNIVAMAIDSTGQGDFMPDMFENNTEWQDERSGLYRIKFSLSSKDVMYKNLKATIQQRLTSLPKLDTKIAERFKLQMLDLQQEHKGQFLSVHHPDTPDSHDDFCFAAGTKILTEAGQANIENVHVGMKVMTRQGLKAVLNAGMTGQKEVITRFGLTATPDHPFITPNGIVVFRQLFAPNEVYVWRNNEVKVSLFGTIGPPGVNLDEDPFSTEKVPVYNLQIEDVHEYFANNVLVHNCDSWALAEWAFARWYADNEPQLAVVSSGKERIVRKNEETGQVEDHWPGLDDDWA